MEGRLDEAGDLMGVEARGEQVKTRRWWKVGLEFLGGLGTRISLLPFGSFAIQATEEPTGRDTKCPRTR